MVNVTTYVFADHLRGTPFLTWWFRAMVSFCLVSFTLHALCRPACVCICQSLLVVYKLKRAGPEWRIPLPIYG